MKKFAMALFSALLLTPMAFGGGIVTNTNSSAAWARYFSRYATIEIDAVYFNPAGLTKLDNGFHFSINNQSIFQTQTLSNDFISLNQSEYIGDVKAPIYPSVYGAFKMGKWAFSAGFNIVGGGGSAKFEKGVPGFEFLSGVNLLQSLNASDIITTQYTVDLMFEGKSVYYGIQAGVSYELNDWISVAAGGRYVMASNQYNGYLKTLMINPQEPNANPGGGMIRADTFFTRVAGLYSYAAGIANTSYGIYDAAINAGVLQAGDPLDPATDAQLIGFLTQFGAYAPGMTYGQALGALTTVEAGAIAGATQSIATASLVTDQDVDVKQTGSGFAPIVSVHLSPVPILDIAVKYEFQTKLQLTNETVSDFLLGYQPDGTPITLYPDGGITNADIPALLAAGVNVRPLPGLQVSAGLEYYFDKNANWDGLEDEIEKNSSAFSFSAQYSFGKFLVSAAWQTDTRNVTPDYQDDLSYSLSATSFGFGGAWNIMDNVRLNLGYVITNYKDASYTNFYGAGDTQTFAKKTNIVAVGLDFSF